MRHVRESSKTFVPYVEPERGDFCYVAGLSYEKQLAQFLRVKRGEQTFRQFARKVGVAASSLQRLEQGDQNVTLRTLRLITTRLKVRLKDIFID